MGELVNEHELWAARQDCVEVHLGQNMALIFDLLAGNHFEAVYQRLGLVPAMRLDDANDDIDAVALFGLSRQQHLVRLADPRGRTEKDLQAAAALLVRRSEQRLR